MSLPSELLSLVDILDAEQRAELSGYLHSKSYPKPVDEFGRARNQRTLSLQARKSILYLSKFADPPAKPTELAITFGVSQQRVSQILGARGHSYADAELLRLFNNVAPAKLRDEWLNRADLERLTAFREGKVAASPLAPRHTKSDANPLGRWSAYTYTFKVYERDGLFYFIIDGDESGESNPRASAKQALDDAAKCCREDAWAFSDGSVANWKSTYNEDPLGPPKAANLARIGDSRRTTNTNGEAA